MKAITETRHAH